MEGVLGRPLERFEHVHHINHVKTDNCPENLTVMTHGEHSRHHHTAPNWSRQFLACIECGTTERRHKARGRCDQCHRRWRYHPT